MSVVRLRYHTIEFGELDIHLRTLRDNQQFSDDEGEAEALGISSAFWPLFGIVWDSGNVLAHLMVEYEIVGLRILEVGCGIALASLVLNHRLADITATDYHPYPGDRRRGGEWRRVEDVAPPRCSCRSGTLVRRAGAAGDGTGRRLMVWPQGCPQIRPCSFKPASPCMPPVWIKTILLPRGMRPAASSRNRPHIALPL